MKKNLTVSMLALGLFAAVASIVGLTLHGEAKQDDARTHAIELNDKAVQEFPKAPEEAFRLLDKAIATDPKYVNAYSNKAVFLSRLKRHDEAAEVMRKAVEISPDFVEGHAGLGMFLEKAGKSDEAQASFKKAIILVDQRIKRDPNDSHARASRAFYIYLTGEETEAIRSASRSGRRRLRERPIGWSSTASSTRWNPELSST